MFPINCIRVTIMNTNHTEKPFTLTDDAAIEDNAAISTAIDKYIAQLIGLAKLYQLTTWEIEIIATDNIGTKKATLIIDSLFRFIQLIISSDYFSNSLISLSISD